MSTRAFGYTASELGLVMAFIFVVEMVRDTPEAQNEKTVEVVPRAEYARVSHERDSLRTVADSLRRTLKSPQLPTCESKHLASGPLFEVIIEADGKFFVDGDDLTLRQVRDKYALEIKRAKDCQCVHVVEARYGPDVPVSVYDRSLAQLEGLFYVKRRGKAE